MNTKVSALHRSYAYSTVLSRLLLSASTTSHSATQSYRLTMERTSAPAKPLLHRSQFDVSNLVPPSRATTAPAGDRTRHQLHHHPRRHHHHRDQSIPQSAIQLHPPGGLFADFAPSKVLTRSNGATLAESAAGRRRESLAAGREDLKKVSRQKNLDKAKGEGMARNE